MARFLFRVNGKELFEARKNRAVQGSVFLVEWMFYNSPTCPKKVSVITGRSASRNAMLISSFLSDSSVAFWQVGHCPVGHSSIFISSVIRLFVCYLLNCLNTGFWRAC